MELPSRPVLVLLLLPPLALVAVLGPPSLAPLALSEIGITATELGPVGTQLVFFMPRQRAARSAPKSPAQEPPPWACPYQPSISLTGVLPRAASLSRRIGCAEAPGRSAEVEEEEEEAAAAAEDDDDDGSETETLL
jgi:hypothetical protein